MISPFFRSVALHLADIAAPAGTGVARTELDGSWSVPIITNSGACDRLIAGSELPICPGRVSDE